MIDRVELHESHSGGIVGGRIASWREDDVLYYRKLSQKLNQMLFSHEKLIEAADNKECGRSVRRYEGQGRPGGGSVFPGSDKLAVGRAGSAAAEALVPASEVVAAAGGAQPVRLSVASSSSTLSVSVQWRSVPLTSILQLHSSILDDKLWSIWIAVVNQRTGKRSQEILCVFDSVKLCEREAFAFAPVLLEYG